jgi:hypothetical protein
MSTAVELLEDRIDAVAANGICWVSRSALVAIISHFLKLKTELEGEADALWIRVRVASDSLPSHVPSSVAHNPPDDVGE